MTKLPLKLILLFSALKTHLTTIIPNNFTDFTLSEQGFKDKISFKRNGVISIIIPGTIFKKAHIEDVQEGRVEIVINNEKKIVFPGHNTYTVKKKQAGIEIKVNKGSVFKGKKGLITYTDETNITYPYYPGYDWLSFDLESRKTYIRVIPDYFMNDKYILTYGILNNSATHISMFGRFNMTKHRFKLLKPMIKNFDIMYMELDTNYSRKAKSHSKEDFYLNTLSSGSPQGNILLSQKKTQAFDLKMMIRLFKGNVNYTTIKGTMDVEVNWKVIDEKNIKFEGKKITLNKLKYYHALYMNKETQETDYLHAIVNTTFGLSQIAKKREISVHSGVVKKSPVIYKKLRLNKEYFAAVLASVEVEGIKTLIDYSVTEVVVKGSNPSRVFPYIYFIILVLVTMGIIIYLYSILKDLKSQPEYLGPQSNFDPSAYKKGGYLETSQNAGIPSTGREGEMKMEYDNGNINPGDVLMSEARQDVSPHKIPDDLNESELKEQMQRTEKELENTKKVLQNMNNRNRESDSK